MLILASASPRRREILDAVGIAYEQVTPDVEELREGAPPEELVVENARRKARAALTTRIPGISRHMGGRSLDVVALGVDTEVVLDGRVLGKAESADEARACITRLSGRTHEVLSGLVLASLPSQSPPEPDERSGVARSLVTFRAFDEATIDLYLDSGEWRDRAGAYAIQGLGSVLVERLEGDFSNVVGLPVTLLLELAPELFQGT